MVGQAAHGRDEEGPFGLGRFELQVTLPHFEFPKVLGLFGVGQGGSFHLLVLGLGVLPADGGGFDLLPRRFETAFDPL